MSKRGVPSLVISTNSDSLEAEEEDEDEEVGRLLLDPLSKEGFLGRVEVVEEEEEVEEVDLAGGRSSSSSSSYL